MAVPVGYMPPPRTLPATASTQSSGLLDQLAARIAGNPQDSYSQGPLTQLAYRMAGPPPATPPRSTGNGIPNAPLGLPLPSDVINTAAGGGSTGGSLFGPNGIMGGNENQRFNGFASGAAAGMNYGPYGALIGGLIGYGANGGVKDANPIDASGFSGITMDRAWENQNLARLASNPAAAVASKLGVSSNSVLGQALDPAGLLGGLFGNKHGDEKRNMSAFLKAYPGIADAGNGNYALPDGTRVTSSQLKDLAGTWYGAVYHPDGDQGGWQTRFNNLVSQIYGQPRQLGG